MIRRGSRAQKQLEIFELLVIKTLEIKETRLISSPPSFFIIHPLSHLVYFYCNVLHMDFRQLSSLLF